jgi:hypothetical protein
MSDAYDYALEAARKARLLPSGRAKQKQRTVARVYHLLAKEAAYAPNFHHLDDFRAASRLESQIAADTVRGSDRPADRARRRLPRP